MGAEHDINSIMLDNADSTTRLKIDPELRSCW